MNDSENDFAVLMLGHALFMAIQDAKTRAQPEDLNFLRQLGDRLYRANAPDTIADIAKFIRRGEYGL